MQSRYKSPETKGFYYTLEPKSSKNVYLAIWKDPECLHSRLIKRNETESTDSFVIRLHSTAIIELQKFVEDEDDYSLLKERLSHESLIKSGQLKNDMGIK